MRRFYACLLAVLFVALFLNGCGGSSSGGSGGETPSTTEPLGNNRVLLGPLAGAAVSAYRLGDLATPIEGPIVTNSESDISKAGFFSLTLAGVPDDEWILVIAEGGVDIDADDDGAIDASPTPNRGKVHALGKASQFRGGNVTVTLLSEIAWHFSQDVLADPEALAKRQKELAGKLLFRESPMGNPAVEADDILRFEPRTKRHCLAFSYAALLPDGIAGRQSLAELIYQNATESQIRELLVRRFGAEPWKPFELKTMAVEQVHWRIPENIQNANPTNMRLRSILDDPDNPPDNPTITDMGGPTILFAENADGQIGLLGYAIPDSARERVAQVHAAADSKALNEASAPQKVEISTRSTALALVMSNGQLIGSTGQERVAIAAHVLELEAFMPFEAQVTEAFRADPVFISHLERYPQIVSQAGSLAKAAIDAFIEEVMAALASLETRSQQDVASPLTRSVTVAGSVKDDFWWKSPWDDAEPWTWFRDEEDQVREAPFLARSGNLVAAGNPEFCHYSAEYFDNDGKFLDWEMVGRNSSLIQKALNSSAAYTELNFPDSTAHVEFNKYGFSTINQGWSGSIEDSPAFAVHLTSWITGVMSVVDVVASGVGAAAEKAVVSQCTKKVVQDALVKMASDNILGTESFSTGMAVLSGAAGSDDSMGVAVLKFINNNAWSAIEPLLWAVLEQAAKEGVVQEGAKIIMKSVTKGAAKLSNPAGWAVVVAEAANGPIPFWWSYLFADALHGYRLYPIGSSFSRVDRNDRRPAGNMTPYPIIDTFYLAPLKYKFDAIGTMDDSPFGDLDFEWTFSDSSGNIVDTGAAAAETVTFSAAGSYTITLAAKDPEGKEGRRKVIVDVTDGKAPRVTSFTARISPENNMVATLSVSIDDEDSDLSEVRWYPNVSVSNFNPDSGYVSVVPASSTQKIFVHSFTYNESSHVAPGIIAVDKQGHQSLLQVGTVAIGSAGIIDRIYPNAGPREGGFTVTVTGRNLDNISSPRLAFIGEEGGNSESKSISLNVNTDGETATFDVPEFEGSGSLTLFYDVSNVKDYNEDGELIGVSFQSACISNAIALVEEGGSVLMGDVYTNPLGMSFKRIPAGTFVMGGPSAGIVDNPDGSEYRVTLTKDYYMQTTEVTQGQWTQVMGDIPYGPGDCGDNCPVQIVSWYDTQEFIGKLNSLGGTVKYRLPTEAEWEYACRAGSDTPYANGMSLSSLGWWEGNSEGFIQPVAGKLPNAWGLYDMHGNVWEWCQDWYGDYPSGQVNDPQGALEGERRVMRGGCYVMGDCKSMTRGNSNPDYNSGMFGLRLVREQ